MKKETVTIDLTEYKRLLDVAFSAESVFKYMAMEGDTFDFMVECGMKRVAEALKKLDLGR